MALPTDFTSLSLLVAAIGIAIVNIINAISNWRTSNKLINVDAKVDTIGAKVDGAATAQVALITALHDKITDKDKVIADNKQVAAVLAATKESK